MQGFSQNVCLRVLNKVRVREYVYTHMYKYIKTVTRYYWITVYWFLYVEYYAIVRVSSNRKPSASTMRMKLEIVGSIRPFSIREI